MKTILTLIGVVAISATTSPTLINNTKVINISQNNLLKQNLKNGNDIAFEKDYRFLAHDFLKAKISYDTFLDMRAIYDNEKPSEVKNRFFVIINNFPKYDYSGAGGYISQDDIYVVINIIIKNFKDINTIFEKLQQGQGLLIVTNTIGSWDKNDYMGVFSQ